MIQFLIILPIYIIAFGVARMLAGGQGDNSFRNWDRLEGRNKITELLMGDKAMSVWWVTLVCIVTTAVFQTNIGVMPESWQSILLFVLMWRAAIAKDPMLTKYSNGEWVAGFKDTLNRGAIVAACMFAATDYYWFVLAAPLYAMGAVLPYYFPIKIWKFERRAVAEFIYMGLAVGVPFTMMIVGVSK